MISFFGKQYQLFFSNNLEPLRALNYADEPFFNEFERLSGTRYRILSVIRKGWQEKYGLQSDVEALKIHFESKLADDQWIVTILSEYEEKRAVLTATLSADASRSYSSVSALELVNVLTTVRTQAATLDAMSNMLHLFSSLVGDTFMGRLKAYGRDEDTTNQNFIFYTQPIKESKYAKLLIPTLDNAIPLSREDAALSAIIRTGAYIKDDVSALLDERGTKLGALFAEIAARLSIDSSDVYYLTVHDIRRSLEAGAIDRALIEARKAITILFYPDRNLKVYEGDAAEEFLLRGSFGEVAVDIGKTLEFTGQAASMGKVIGRAVVVKNSRHAIKYVGAGDILVAPYTAPEYLPAMKQAVAIVTETGGITSHAAIVSRELGIPCVIGVPNIMAELHTGDRIEVDAGKGIVRKL